jgi:hypothetical protein
VRAMRKVHISNINTRKVSILNLIILSTDL